MSGAPSDPQPDPDASAAAPRLAGDASPGAVSATAGETEIPAADVESAVAEGSRSLDHRRERIRVQTATHRIEGNVTLARDGFRSRVSDMLNASERDFLILTDATVVALDGGPLESHSFLALARRHIVFAVLADTPE